MSHKALPRSTADLKLHLQDNCFGIQLINMCIGMCSADSFKEATLTTCDPYQQVSKAELQLRLQPEFIVELGWTRDMKAYIQKETRLRTKMSYTQVK